MHAGSYRARSATELVDGTIRLYRSNFATYLTLGAVMYVPILVAKWTLFGASRPSTAKSLFVLLLMVTWGAVCYAVIICVTSDLYTTGAADIPAAIQRARPRFRDAIASSVVAITGVVLGFLLLVIPGILLALSWFAIPAVAVLEDPFNITDALARSAALSRGNKGHIAITFTILGLLTAAINLLAALTGTLLAEVLRTRSIAVGLGLLQLTTGISTICLGTLTPIMATLLYYDARIRNEGYDIELMARTVGGVAAPASAY